MHYETMLHYSSVVFHVEGQGHRCNIIIQTHNKVHFPSSYYTHAADNDYDKDSSNVVYINDIFGGRDCYSREPIVALTLASPIHVPESATVLLQQTQF